MNPLQHCFLLNRRTIRAMKIAISCPKVPLSRYPFIPDIIYANVCAIHCVACVYARVCSRYLLVFDGVKMGASIYVNKVLLGQTSDQFLRYTFPLTKAILQTGVMSTPDDTTTSISSTHTLTVEFSPNIDCDGRWMGCSGGWDWVWSKNRPVFFS